MKHSLMGRPDPPGRESMFMVREVLLCKAGKVGELKKKFQALAAIVEELGYPPFRLYTDVSGERFWTLVVQTEFEELGGFHAMEEAVMSDARAGTIMSGYHDLLVEGRREIYKVAT
jgi:hypothetical protein